MILSEFTGKDLCAARRTGRDPEMIQPALQSTNHLLNAPGRTQVEMATASVAVHRVNATAPILPILKHSDDMLRKIARKTIHAGQTLEQSIHRPLFSQQSTLEQALADLVECHQGLQSLKKWALMTFASGLQVQMNGKSV